MESQEPGDVPSAFSPGEADGLWLVHICGPIMPLGPQGHPQARSQHRGPVRGQGQLGSNRPHE